MAEQTRVEATWVSYGDAVRLFLRGATAGTAARIALVVGTWLTSVETVKVGHAGHVGVEVLDEKGRRRLDIDAVSDRAQER